MNLLIIGAGSHGKVTAEIAEECGYDNVAFLDDNSIDAIGKLEDIKKFVGEYEYAFVSIGDNKLRGELINKLENAGYKVPVLIHPTAYVSKSVKIMNGTLVEPKAIINANSTIGMGCIISVGSIIDHNVNVGDCCHINVGSIVKAGSKIDSHIKSEVGQIIL